MKVKKKVVFRIRFFLRLLEITIFVGAILCSGVLHAAVIQHDIGSHDLIIPGNSTDDYVVTGSTTNHYIEVELGYHGSITLQNCSISFATGQGSHSPIHIVGKDEQPNDDPLTVVNLILEGNNVIQNTGGGRACIQVDQGAQINISAIDPCDNNSGILVAQQLNEQGGAAIGSLNHLKNPNEPTATAPLYDQYGNPTGSEGTTAGGNVVISSGTITAKGGHGAGIGGGYRTYYDGMIVIYGGIVNATSDFDAAGIGSGCPLGTGVIQEFAPHSAIIALPPAVISAQGAGATPYGGIGHNLFSTLGLAGTKVRVYIGDPNMTDCPINVYTEDHTPNANIYVDLSQDPDINGVVAATVDPAMLDIHQIFFGTADDSGLYSTTGKLRNNTTFFTDAISISPSSYGHPYLPKVATLPSGGNVQLERLMADFRIETFPSTLLELGYSSAEAHQNATCVKLVYNDADPIEDVQFDLANGAATDFDNLIFLAADSTTVIPAPTALRQGETYYIIIPLQTGKGAYIFSDVFRIIGVWQGASTSYIRQIVTQIVAYIHAEFICEGESYLFNGEELTEEGMYSNITTTTSPCQALSSVEVVDLSVIPSVTSSFEDIGCDEYVWNDIEYTASGQYDQVFQSCVGCDSIVTLNLTINLTEITHETAVACGEYEWKGDTYNQTGTYEHYEGQTVHGCDSIAVLDLIIHPVPPIEILGYTQVAFSSDLWPGIYHYYIVDSANYVSNTVTWSCSNPEWVFVPLSGFHCLLIAKSQGTALLSADAFTNMGCNVSASLEINASNYGIGDGEENSVALFPNPAQTQVTVQAQGLSQIKLFNVFGQAVKEFSIEQTETATFSIDDLSQGAYMVEITTVYGRIIKQLVISR